MRTFMSLNLKIVRPAEIVPSPARVQINDLVTAALWVVAVVLLASCAEVPQTEKTVRTDEKPLVFPPPPDEPRFVYERTIYSSVNVIEKDKNAEFRRLVTGERENAGEGMAKPYGVAARHGRVYVADSGGQSVKVFDIPNKKFSIIGADGPGMLYMPLGLELDGAENLYVVDGGTKTVKVYGPDGTYLRQFGGPKWFSRPTGIAVDHQGKRAYVVDTGGVEKEEEHRVRVFDARTGEHLFDFGKRGHGPGEFNLARDIAIAPNGLLYVVDGGNFRVQVFQQDGKFVRSFGEVGVNMGQFARPKEVAIDKSGNVYVSDAAFGNFQIFNAEGQLLMFIGNRSEQDGPARYLLPAGIAVDEDGRVYMADQFFRKVDVFRPANLKPDEGFGVRKQENKAFNPTKTN